MPSVFPLWQGKWMRQQRPASIGVVGNSQGHLRKKCNCCGFECILKKHGKIESPLSPFANLIPGRYRAGTIVNQNLIDKVGVDEDVRRARSRNQSDMRLGQHAPQLAQSGDAHCRVAQPVWNADDNAFDLIQF